MKKSSQANVTYSTPIPCAHHITKLSDLFEEKKEEKKYAYCSSWKCTYCTERIMMPKPGVTTRTCPDCRGEIKFRKVPLGQDKRFFEGEEIDF